MQLFLKDRRWQVAIAMLVAGVCAATLCIVSPLRATSGDTVPARLAAMTLPCGGDLDLSRIDWVRARETQEPPLYWGVESRTRQVISVYGPGPGVVASVALVDFTEGAEISDVALRHRERAVAATLLAISAALLALAGAARAQPSSAAASALVAVASFAGAATLGQGMWQASVSLPWLMAGLATLAWRDRVPWCAYLTPALAVMAVALRPTIGPLAMGVGVIWVLDARGLKLWAVASALAFAVVTPLVIWNVVQLGTPFPTGQWISNQRVTSQVFDAHLGAVGFALGGLTLSPGRGLLWYAPLALLGVVTALRRTDRLVRGVAIASIAQVAMISLFYRWSGGAAYGPRFLSEMTWLSIWLAMPALAGRAKRWWIACAIVTVVVGQLGLWRFRYEQWEMRRMPDIDETALWDVIDSPITATFRGIEDQLAGFDSPGVAGYQCRKGMVTSIPQRNRR